MLCGAAAAEPYAANVAKLLQFLDGKTTAF
jgi:hypothetical protein